MGSSQASKHRAHFTKSLSLPPDHDSNHQTQTQTRDENTKKTSNSHVNRPLWHHQKESETQLDRLTEVDSNQHFYHYHHYYYHHHHDHPNTNNTNHNQRASSRGSNNEEHVAKQQSHSNSGLDKVTQHKFAESLDLFNRNLKSYLAKQNFNHMNANLQNEWKLIALIVDRVLFWTFTIITIISSIVLLIIVPVVKNKIKDNDP